MTIGEAGGGGDCGSATSSGKFTCRGIIRSSSSRSDGKNSAGW